MKQSIMVDGVEYVSKGSEAGKPPVKLNGLEYCVVRTYSAGVFAGFVKSRKGQEAVVLQARRLWHWSGAASLSQLAVDGVAKPNDCKFPVEVERVELTNVIEVLPCTKKAQESIKAVPVWKM